MSMIKKRIFRAFKKNRFRKTIKTEDIFFQLKVPSVVQIMLKSYHCITGTVSDIYDDRIVLKQFVNGRTEKLPFYKKDIHAIYTYYPRSVIYNKCCKLGEL